MGIEKKKGVPTKTSIFGMANKDIFRILEDFLDKLEQDEKLAAAWKSNHALKFTRDTREGYTRLVNIFSKKEKGLAKKQDIFN